MTHKPRRLYWGILWQSNNRAEGKRAHLVCEGLPLLFNTRHEARVKIDEKFSYIRHRPDLRQEPHGWQMPKAVRVQATYKVQS